MSGANLRYCQDPNPYEKHEEGSGALTLSPDPEESLDFYFP